MARCYELRRSVGPRSTSFVTFAFARLYWKLGNYILQNQSAKGYGAKVIDELSADIRKDFPLLKGFSARNLGYMKKFAEIYPIPVLQEYLESVELLRKEPKKVQQVIAKMEKFENQSFIILQHRVAKLAEGLFLETILSKVGWAHHVILMDKVNTHSERLWYLLNTLENGISRNILMIQIESGLFKRQVKAEKVSNFSNTLPAMQTDFATYMLKDPYIFDFVQAKGKADERDIERQLTEHVTKFLLELGQGFAFVGKQVHFEIGQTDFYVDLLFYHIKLRAYVVVELKTGEFEPGDAGQINFYVNLVNDKLKTAEDNDTIGILLCKGKNKVLAEYALKSIKHPIGVSDYQLSKAIPEELRSQLPQIDDLEKELISQ
ncbi:MAG TPA: PDDEXK nuclease domain-containing protein [Chitinophagaceae bacterium]|nr:PDDEXK nuclease domain-containing protein [Chitinophagaceae bacterium]